MGACWQNLGLAKEFVERKPVLSGKDPVNALQQMGEFPGYSELCPETDNATAEQGDALPVDSPATEEYVGAEEYVGEGPLNQELIERWIIEFTNRERSKAGLSPLSHDPAISVISRQHSDNMVRTGEFSHEIGGDNPTDRATKAGYDCKADQGGGRYTYGLAENIGKEYTVKLWRGEKPTVFHSDSESMVAAIVQDWMDSPGHRENILTSCARCPGAARTSALLHGCSSPPPSPSGESAGIRPPPIAPMP